MGLGPSIDKNCESVEKSQRDQMLKLVTKGFYQELLNYGVSEHEIVSVSANLLDEILKMKGASSSQSLYRGQLSMLKVVDQWSENNRLSYDKVSIQPLPPDEEGLKDLSLMERWLEDPSIQSTIISLFPKTKEELCEYFNHPHRNYFIIKYEDITIGIIGADNIDTHSSKLEMRKYVGAAGMRGKGIGKTATFLFLYWCFMIKNFNKVYLRTCNINIRNINLNSKMGFVLEGIMPEDLMLNNKTNDVVRMGLLKPHWVELFS